jgi:hypothetical protein
MILVDTMPKVRLFQRLLVALASIFSSVPPVKTLNPVSSDNIPKRKIATPAEITLKSGLTQNPQLRVIKIEGSSIFRSILNGIKTGVLVIKQ